MATSTSLKNTGSGPDMKPLTMPTLSDYRIPQPVPKKVKPMSYEDTAECPNGHEFLIWRRIFTAGRIAGTTCPVCRARFQSVAGPVPEDRKQTPVRESTIERRLVARVKELGGEVRKVKWEGRRGAPDRLVMLPPFEWDGASREGYTIWVELKKPGKAAKFPSTPHEHAQHREHERMRKMGQRVEVVDSFERIEEILS